MQIHTFRAGSMQEALQQVRFALGPDAAVLQTREVRRNLIQWLAGTREIEVVASKDVYVPSRLPKDLAKPTVAEQTEAADANFEDADEDEFGYWRVPPADEEDYRRQYRECLKMELGGLRSLVEDLSQNLRSTPTNKV